jgi:hypothetical protein
VRADVGVAELAGGRRWRCARVREEWRGASEKRGAARRGGGDDDEGGREVIWGENG